MPAAIHNTVVGTFHLVGATLASPAGGQRAAVRLFTNRVKLHTLSQGVHVTDNNKADRAKASVRESVDGLANQAKGKVEDAVGGLTGDLKLQAKGKMDQAKGIVEKQVGKVLRPTNEEIDEEI